MKTKPQNVEYKAFENLLGKVLGVSKTELNRRIEEGKKAKRETKSPASRASVSPTKPA